MIVFAALHSLVAGVLLASFTVSCLRDHRAGKSTEIRDVVVAVIACSTWEVSLLLPMAIAPWFGAVVGILREGCGR